MNSKIRDIIFFAICSTVIFQYIPALLQMNFIGGTVGDKLVFYPMFIGLVYTIICQIKYRNIFCDFKKFLIYIFFYLGVVLISLVYGLYNFPYTEILLQGPITQIEKLPKILSLFTNMGISIETTELIKIWMYARCIKSVFLEVLYNFFFSYIVFCWYRKDCHRAIDVLCKAIFFSLGIIFTYSSIEVLYLAGNEYATRILKTMAPYLHKLGDNGFWWPPVLWKAQLRSVFAEPSHFGIYAAFCFPFLWLIMLKKEIKYRVVGITVLMSFLLFLTKARTGFLLHLGELFLMIVIVLCINYQRFLKKLLIVLMCSILGFITANLFIDTFMSSMNKEKIDLANTTIKYVDSNAVSVINPDSRSNRARYSVLETDFKIGLDNPILGVGSGLRSWYMPDYFSEKAKANSEVKMWLFFIEKFGGMKYTIPRLGEFAPRFAETGIMGLLVYMVLPIVLLWKLIKVIIKDNDNLEAISVFIAFCAMIANGIFNGIGVYYWILLGIGFAMCDKNKIGGVCKH